MDDCSAVIQSSGYQYTELDKGWSLGACPRDHGARSRPCSWFQARKSLQDWVPHNGCPGTTWNCKSLKTWSGRGDSNPWPPGPETKKIGQGVDFSIHVSGASTA